MKFTAEDFRAVQEAACELDWGAAEMEKARDANAKVASLSVAMTPAATISRHRDLSAKLHSLAERMAKDLT